ncbi:dihydrodipicolinate synthase family protein [Phycisphaerales bacterium AB-hyl4]|uniref:Dihydrodipicolinate synthase family protein n=1 Tax=Natronomicrosphaera hydrolytica TaxID=3242702 RepID=A0ABV4U8U1_9BACT
MGGPDVNPTKNLRGVLPVFQMPYHDDESIDYTTLDQHIDWIYEQGAHGLVFAMVSEVLRLSDRERRQVAEHLCKTNRDRGAVIISVGAESTHTACELARHAESVGADAIMAIPPVSTAIDEAELRHYYDRLANALTIPVIVQDASGYVGKPMSIDFQAALRRDLGDRIMFKPEATPIGPRLSALREATAGQADIFEGTGGIALVDSYRRGIVGTMPGGDLVWALAALWQALEAGDDQRTYRISLPLSSLVAIQTSLDSFLAVEKYLLQKQGVFPNTVVRGPRGYQLDEETRQEVDRLFDLLTASVYDMAGESA